MSQINDNAKARKGEARARGQESKRRVMADAAQVADWGAQDAELILRAIEVVAKQGGALRFGYTRDGGAYALGIMGDGEPYTEYLRPGDDVGGYFQSLVAQWE